MENGPSRNEQIANRSPRGSAARTRSPVTRKRISESNRKRWAVDSLRRTRASQTLKEAWADPELHETRASNALKGRRASEAQKRASEAIKRSWKNPKVRARRRQGLSRAMRRRWANPEQAKALTESIRKSHSTPEARKRSGELAKQRWANPEVRERTVKGMSERAKRVYVENPARRQQVSEHSKQMWAERAAKLAAAWRPADWREKPPHWRIIGSELLSTAEVMSNRELADRLDRARVACPHGSSWKVSLDKKACSEFLRKIRGWVKRPARMALGKAA